jgi:hypothetical protein
LRNEGFTLVAALVVPAAVRAESPESPLCGLLAELERNEAPYLLVDEKVVSGIHESVPLGWSVATPD